MLKYEQQTNFTQYKFGVMYAPTGCIDEDDMYRNSSSTSSLLTFSEIVAGF